MLDIKLIREKPDFVRQRLATRGAGDEIKIEEILKLDEVRRAALSKVEKHKNERNRVSKEIGALMAKKELHAAEAKKLETRDLGETIAHVDEQIAEIEAKRDALMLQLPNLPHESVALGKSAEDNPEVRVHGAKQNYDFKLKSHVELCENLKLVDFVRAAKLSGSGFLLYTNWGARLERALIQFLLDLHITEHGYTEVSPPLMVGEQCLVGVGQFPKFKDQYYGVAEGDDAKNLGKLYLIPTAETPVANIHREEILAEKQLPVRYCAYTPCFRGEAGAAGVGTRGMIRVHQFDKVELIKIVKPENGYDELEKMVVNAEKVLQLLGLHYRVIMLCTGDMGFGSAKTYDIEVWAPGQGGYLEVSSCSNCEDFQSRRMNLRFKTETGENKFPHILNGSGTALARLFVALIETHQQSDGSVKIPAPLQPYLKTDRITGEFYLAMKILLASSEVHPFSKTGGLADMVAALGKALAHAGHEARIVTPLYRGIREKFPGIRRVDWEFDLPLGAGRAQAELFSLEIEIGLSVYFIHHPAFFDRVSLYEENNRSYADNAERFIFFSKCVAHLARYLAWRPDVVHVHDWQAALVPALILQQRREGWGNPPPTCLTIHNLAYQGTFPAAAFALTNLPEEFFTVEGAEFYKQLNCLKAGIAFADAITTVSPRYAREITTEEFGCGLDGFLRRRQNKLFGILNGVDYSDWNTTDNKFLPHPYSAMRLSGKTACKLALQKELGLPVKKDLPLFGTISRLAEQKGVDIQLGALEEMLSADIQFILLGSGSADYERGYHALARRFPDKVAVRTGYNESLAHRIEAACDFFIMPSRFEPSGLNQMYSLRYGTIPIVRATGGLDDSVVDFTEDAASANGIKFREYSARALAKAIRKALAIYQQSDLIRHFRQNGMRADFSWELTVEEYVKIYEVINNLQARIG